MSCGFVKGHDTRHPLIGYVKVAPVDSKFNPFQEHYHVGAEVHAQSFPRSNDPVSKIGSSSNEGFAFLKAEGDGFKSGYHTLC